jgi:hypothetical protein
MDPAGMAQEVQMVTDVQLTNLQGDLIAANFVTTARDGTQAYRQTRFYRLTAEDWRRTMPDADLWGAPRRLESTYFVFHYRQNDAEVVNEVAPQIDALYEELRHNFGLTPDAEKLVIEVTVARETGTFSAIPWQRDPLFVPSPALYLAPVELTDADILAQSIMLPLIEYMGERAIKVHAIPPHWQSLLRGVKLWQLWDLEMPLAQWRNDIVKLLYIEVPTADLKRQPVQLLARYTELCAMHRLWMQWPLLVGIPLDCTEWEPLSWLQGMSLVYIPRIRLDQLTLPRTGQYHYFDQDHVHDFYPYHSSEAVKAAILVEYAVSVYGYEPLPLLLSGMAQYSTWDTLLPSAYGASSSEFEEGWRAYLTAHYQ